MERLRARREFLEAEAKREELLRLRMARLARAAAGMPEPAPTPEPAPMPPPTPPSRLRRAPARPQSNLLWLAAGAVAVLLLKG
jgi:hypothetical protein